MEVALLALEVPCAMPMCPARHYEMPERGEINQWHYLAQLNCCGQVSVIEGADIHGKWGIFNMNWACR